MQSAAMSARRAPACVAAWSAPAAFAAATGYSGARPAFLGLRAPFSSSSAGAASASAASPWGTACPASAGGGPLRVASAAADPWAAHRLVVAFENGCAAAFDLLDGQLVSAHVPEETREEAALGPRLARGAAGDAFRITVANVRGPGGLAFLGASAPGVVALAQARARAGGGGGGVHGCAPSVPVCQPSTYSAPLQTRTLWRCAQPLTSSSSSSGSAPPQRFFSGTLGEASVREPEPAAPPAPHVTLLRLSAVAGGPRPAAAAAAAGAAAPRHQEWSWSNGGAAPPPLASAPAPAPAACSLPPRPALQLSSLLLQRPAATGAEPGSLLGVAADGMGRLACAFADGSAGLVAPAPGRRSLGGGEGDWRKRARCA